MSFRWKQTISHLFTDRIVYITVNECCSVICRLNYIWLIDDALGLVPYLIILVILQTATIFEITVSLMIVTRMAKNNPLLYLISNNNVWYWVNDWIFTKMFWLQFAIVHYWCDEISRFSVYAVILKDFILYKYLYLDCWIWNALYVNRLGMKYLNFLLARFCQALLLRLCPVFALIFWRHT